MRNLVVVGHSGHRSSHGLSAGASRLPLVQMIGQRQRHAVAQFGCGEPVAGVEQDAAVAAKTQLRIELAKCLDQIGLAMEIDRDLPSGLLHLIDPDRAAAFGFRGEITWLSPFQGFLQRADALCRFRGIEDQPAQRQQLCLDRLGAGLC
jgi:hypothetical protein